MKYAIVENGKVTNIAVADPEFAAQFNNWINANDAKIGDLLVDGQFVDPPVDLELLAQTVREQRNILLAQSDWTQLEDVPIEKTPWVNYRQSLRDIPQQQGFPQVVVWPMKP